MTSDLKTNGSSLSDLPPQGRQKSASYPSFTLQQAEALAKVVFEQGARNCDQERVAQAAGYKSITSGSFLRLKSTANQFGLLQIEKNGCFSVTQEWIDVFHHSEDLQLLKKARGKAILRPKLYQQLIEEYTDRQLPQLDKLSRELHLSPKYSILKDAAEIAARIFHESASYAGLLNERGYLVVVDQQESQIKKEDIQRESREQDTVTTRQEVAKPSLNHDISTTPQNNSFAEVSPNLEGLEKYEITLINRKKAYLYVPVPLPYGEKKRLKQYIDLILEEPSHSSSRNSLMEEDGWSSEE